MQKESSGIVPVKDVLEIINSCETTKQLISCKSIINNYIKLLEKKKIINTDIVRKRLLKEYKQKKFQLNMLKLFIKNNHKEFYEVHSKVIA